MKRAILLLLSFLAVVSMSAVSAENVTTTKYFVHVNGMSDDEIQSIVDSYKGKWSDFEPKIVGIKNGNIYFASEKDLFRFLMPISYSKETFVFPIENIIAYDGDRALGNVKMIYFYESHGNNLNGQRNGYKLELYVNNTTIPIYAVIKGAGDTHINANIVNRYFAWNYIYSNTNVTITSGWYGGWGVCAIFAPATIGYKITPMGNEYKFYFVKDIKFNLKTLEIYTEPDATVYIDGNNVGTTDNGGYLKIQITSGKHELKITKEGFWDYTTTIEIKNDTTLHIDLTPKNSIFRVSYNVTDAYPNSVAEVRLTLNPIRTAYGATMQISGVDVVKVYYKNALLAPSSGAYVLGTVDSPVDVEIQFKTPSSWGDHSFAVTLTASDIEGNQYTTQKQITYNVKELPFLIQQPDNWKIGDNVVTITDQSGEDYSILLTLKDLNGTELWSQSQGFNAYDSHDFVVPIKQAGDYVLEILAKGGEVKTYIPIHVIEPIKLLTPEINATKGGVASVKLEIENPTSSVKYYDAQVIGEIFDVNNTPKTEFSIAPGETKTVELKFKVPDKLQFSNYELTVEVFEKNSAKPIFSDNVVLNIVEGSFLPIGGDSGIPIWALVPGIILLGGIGAYLLFRN